MLPAATPAARMVAGQRKRPLSPGRRRLYKNHDPNRLGDFKKVWAYIGVHKDPTTDWDSGPDHNNLLPDQPALGDRLANLLVSTDASENQTLAHHALSMADGEHSEEPVEIETSVSNDGENPNVFSPELNPSSSPEPEIPASPTLGMPSSAMAAKFTHHGSHVCHQSFALSNMCQSSVEARAAAFALRMNGPVDASPEKAKTTFDDLRRVVLADFKSHDEDSMADFPAEYANGIYVYIDWSNIMIGCQEELKRGYGLPPTSRRADVLDFARIKLILERDRGIKSRVLAGSRSAKPGQKELKTLDAFVEHGYDASILERVYRPNEQAQARPGYGLPLETSPRKMQEQGVDEILQMKISDDIIDGVIAGTPGVVVLATGDGNEAQFSKGFFAKQTAQQGPRSAQAYRGVRAAHVQNACHPVYGELPQEADIAASLGENLDRLPTAKLRRMVNRYYGMYQQYQLQHDMAVKRGDATAASFLHGCIGISHGNWAKLDKLFDQSKNNDLRGSALGVQHGRKSCLI
ncbi:conserved hypothetical protein [Verticillium alfalfae VaMs.102]|uniref:NYN domain-containing protein n=1 Tax=Verticillium alfalfae (strain VaMs.102 / ATCC MYA-4576 / FGSC 10136) TaxID=526221 RepID=C9SRC1_VERA1|nr:conserved hypothetical protein [Verticillium alfalfae VaMs.102]EEY21336.1 conserved hypothetical protein [Verticillium alfalfae VaMs.102]